MAIISISLPDALLAQMQRHIEQRAFSGRSELVRAALRDYLNRDETGGGSDRRHAALTVIYGEGQERKVADIRHDFTAEVKALMHGHAPGACVEVVLVEGEVERIRRFAELLRACMATRLVQLTFTDTAEADASSSHG